MAVFSHEMITAILILLAPLLLLQTGFSSQNRNKLLITLAPSLIFGIFIALNAMTYYDEPLIFSYIGSGFHQYVSYDQLVLTHLSLFVLLYGSIIPFVLVGFRRIVLVNHLFLILLFLSFAPLFLPTSFFPFSHRWMMMLSVPFSFYAAEGLLKTYRLSQKPRFLKILGTALPTMLLVSATIFTTVPPNASPLFLFDEDMRRNMPTSMISNTVPIENSLNLLEVFAFLNNSMDNSSALFLHESFYDWAKITLDSSKNVISSGSLDPVYMVDTAFNQGYHRVYLIAWVKEEYAWHDLSPPEEGFQRVFQSGTVGVYYLDHASPRVSRLLEVT
jgi:hypothetical protein